MKKRIFSVALCIILAFSCFGSAFAAQSTAKLNNIYDDDMLFKQNEKAVFVGTATPGSTITAELFLVGTVPHAFGVSTTDSDGFFSVSFDAPEGGYTEYTVVLSENGTEFERLERVVFGELWLSSGQSNMQYPLAQAKTGVNDFQTAAKQSKWIRVMLSSPYPADGIAPVEPRRDIPDADWITGEDIAVYNSSAVGFFFAEKLMEEIDMPIGILNLSLGGTSIFTWLSRQAIESDEKVRDSLVESGRFIPLNEWDSTNVDYTIDMTVNYNLRIEAVKHLHISGMIWYQGESDIIYGNTGEVYSDAVDLLQSSYTELFGYENGKLPFVFTQLAPYYYTSYWDIPSMNCDFTAIQAKSPSDRALVTIYDLPATYITELGAIHPEHKEEIGNRMAHTAVNLVYGGDGVTTAANVRSAQTKDSDIYVTFNNIGDGLAFNGKFPGGFAVCGDDGVYIQAQAELVSADTIRIYADGIDSPASASYAYFMGTQQSNLCSTENGVPVLPVSPFVTDPSYNTQFWIEKPWADCETQETVHNNNDKKNVNANIPVPSWLSDNADISFSPADAYSGEKGMSIISTDAEFEVSPYTGTVDGLEYDAFYDSEKDYSRYSALSFYVRNNGTQDIRFEGVKFHKDSVLWFAPESTDTAEPQVVVPADGEWHLIRLDLNRLCLWGNECGISYPNDVLENIQDIRFCFSGKDAQLSFDEIRFSAMAEETGARFDARLENADNLLEVVSAVFVSLIGSVVSLFG